MVPGFDAGTPTQAAFGCLLSKRCRDWTGKANRMRVPSMRFSAPRSNELCAFHARSFAHAFPLACSGWRCSYLLAVFLSIEFIGKLTD